MLPETQRTLAQVSATLDELNNALQQELSALEQSGAPASKIEQVRAGAKAIKDCGNMLLVWSDYIARGDIGHDHGDDSLESIESRPDRFPR
ncbi:MAG: hypothetical protein HY208_06035 [Nitrospirae bacterium]|nr:hypothetical protein [Nitrospirota bacterium]